MYRHLVTVKISIEGSANQRMELDSTAIDEHWLKSLDAQSV